MEALEFVKRLKDDIFLRLLPSHLFKTNGTYFIMLFVDCLAHFHF